MEKGPLITEVQRRRAVDWAVAMTANTPLAPQRYERQLLARYQQGELTIDQVIELLDSSVYQVLYRSQAIEPMTDAELQKILDGARQHNARHDITGMLLYSGGQFVQALEGPEGEVRALYASIQQDTRHTQVVTICAGPVAARHFAEWSMVLGQAHPDEIGHLLQAVQTQQPQSEPGIQDPHLLALLRAFGVGQA